MPAPHFSCFTVLEFTLQVMAPDTELTDGAAVAAVLNGQREMYRILVRRYQDVLFRHARRMVGSSDDAADLVQKALVRGYQNLGDCRDPDRFGGWVFRVTNNLCKDFLKSPRRGDLSIEAADATIVMEEDPSGLAEKSELRTNIHAALDDLSSDLREAFVLKHLEGRTYDEMCQLLGASKSALKMRVMRAREELQTHLEAYR
jgi:RNA polymerase sigma-70 factor (ECF subfamily)